MNVRKIVLIATGKNKADAIKNLVHGKITEKVSSSILRNHLELTIYVDEDTYSFAK
ncbi:MAG: hypothetical protein PHS54_06040 [Clostridia bacterium]|nr:hypothetical protein [Clostridia bacterium]